uniref:Transcription initiation factor TFIID subunit 6 n=1 Tax=Ditylenchus dipsaci TaxID=166011 RepID=A0A915D957_9BILA
MELSDENEPSTSEVVSASTSFGPDFVMLVAEQLGITELTELLASEVSAHVSFVARSVLNMARKFQNSGKRRTMISDDVEGALAFYGLTPQFGYEIPGYDHIPFRHAGQTLGKDLYVREDPEIELTTLVNSAPPKLPLEMSIKSHWLVIDGQQPAIPENPVIQMQQEAPVVNLDEKTNRLPNYEDAPLLLNQFAKLVRKTEQVQVKTHTTTHALSLEQQVFFKEITEAIMGNDETKRTEALHCLQFDCGLHALLPRISITIHEGVRCNIVTKNLAILIYLMRMIQALVQNENISIERCLHELLPSVMSCILSRQLCSNLQSDKHWALREFSAKLLARIAEKYKHHPTLRSRITNELARPFKDTNCALATLYGAIFALNMLGEDTIRTVVVPKVDAIFSMIKIFPTIKLCCQLLKRSFPGLSSY